MATFHTNFNKIFTQPAKRTIFHASERTNDYSRERAKRTISHKSKQTIGIDKLAQKHVWQIRADTPIFEAKIYSKSSAGKYCKNWPRNVANLANKCHNGFYKFNRRMVQNSTWEMFQSLAKKCCRNRQKDWKIFQNSNLYVTKTSTQGPPFWDALNNVDREASTFWWEASVDQNFSTDENGTTWANTVRQLGPRYASLVDQEASTFWWDASVDLDHVVCHCSDVDEVQQQTTRIDEFSQKYI